MIIRNATVSKIIEFFENAKSKEFSSPLAGRFN
jgi:hypothetical protein